MESILQIKVDEKIYEGNVTYEEGDLIEAVFSERIAFSAGESVNCLLTRSYEAVHSFQGVVLAREHNRLILFHPPTAVEFREQRRRYPRFDVKLAGWIRQLHMDASQITYRDTSIEIINIGLGGLAFRCEKQLPLNAVFVVYTELAELNHGGDIMQARVQILHERAEKSFLYGCKIKEITSKNFHTLRKYILQRQLEELKLISK